MFDDRVISFGPGMRRSVLAAGIAGGLFVALAGSAQAQFFGWWGTPPAYGVPQNAMISPNEIYRMVADQGYQISGRLERSGHVYLIDVIDRRGRPERLVIDAYQGDILQRFATAPPRPTAMIPQPRLQSHAELDSRYAEPPASGYPPYPVDREPTLPGATNREPQVIPGIGRAAGEDTRRGPAAKTQTATREIGGSGKPAKPSRAARAEAAPHSTRATGSEAALPQPAAKITPAIGTAAPPPPAKPEKETAAATPEPAAKADQTPAPAAPPPAPSKPVHTDGPGYANGVPINPLD